MHTHTRSIRVLLKLRVLLVIVAALWPLAAAAPLAQAGGPPSVGADLRPADYNARAILIVHYLRPDADYTGWNLWTWPDAGQGRAAAFDGVTEAGRYAVVPVEPGPGRQGLIVRRGEWAAKDIGHDRFVDLEADGVTEIWLVSGDEQVYTDPSRVDLTVRLGRAFLDGAQTINVSASGLLGDSEIDSAKILSAGQRTAYEIASFERRRVEGATGIVYELTLARPVDEADIAALELAVGPREPVTIFAREVLVDPRFTPTGARLGAEYAPDRTTFRVWSPVSSKVEVMLYDALDTAEPSRVIEMKPTEKGVWEAIVEGDLHAVAYQYRYTSYGKERVGPDIYARAATGDSTRSVVVDLARTNPPDWDTIAPPRVERPTDELIYEVHVRDFSIDDRTLEKPLRGTYLGLIHEGEADRVTTGLAHLRELGVTAVHLMPIHDYPARPDEYNWGYWTSLFNVPESNYATDPADPMAPIEELKIAIAGLHRAGIRVILDVVYNHTSSSFEHSAFDNAVPWYYFRTSIDGQLLNDAGVGNSIADERPMVRDYIVDSCVFWASHYKVDGFRFDLLGTHHPETIRAVCAALADVRDDLTIYGEPWTGGGPIHFGKGAQRGTCFAVFNDHLRNAIRGDLDGDATGFATGPGLDLASMKRGIAGAIDDFTNEPTETINYASAHDNLTLWDKISKVNPRATDDEKRAMQKLALGVVLTSQGVPFLHAGSEFCRTKGGNHNSYNAGDDVNELDWDRKRRYLDVFEYAKGLAALRAAHPAFRLSDDAQIRKNLRFVDVGLSLAYTLDGAAVGDEWATILVGFNAEPGPQVLRFPPGRWVMVVSDSTAGTKTLRKLSGLYRVPPYSMVVFHKE